MVNGRGSRYPLSGNIYVRRPTLLDMTISIFIASLNGVEFEDYKNDSGFKY